MPLTFPSGPGKPSALLREGLGEDSSLEEVRRLCIVTSSLAVFCVRSFVQVWLLSVEK